MLRIDGLLRLISLRPKGLKGKGKGLKEGSRLIHLIWFMSGTPLDNQTQGDKGK